MKEVLAAFVDYIAATFETVGVVIIVVGVGLGLVRFLRSIRSREVGSYKKLRQEIGRSMLLGLEVLVAGDIIATVATAPKMDQVLTLGLIVLIRTFLSFSLELEVEGQFPWVKRNEKAPSDYPSGTS